VFKENELFKIGDLVQLDNQFCPERHPPMGTYGIVIDVENWPRGECHDSNSDSNELVEIEQFINVYWAHHLNVKEQCYTEVSLKKVASA